ncbi:hypothetical protein [Methylacidimicrobium cyclopophantes]|uniref:hypothetical protein n=1 Tax=Methylacidimicrobium cyclopophantes TaxID=1041766 RepID=UPI001157C7D4|nr:hypothetical protein [Methylacidimicrobium cyclopophantes]
MLPKLSVAYMCHGKQGSSIPDPPLRSASLLFEGAGKLLGLSQQAQSQRRAGGTHFLNESGDRKLTPRGKFHLGGITDGQLKAIGEFQQRRPSVGTRVSVHGDMQEGQTDVMARVESASEAAERTPTLETIPVQLRGSV